MKISSFALVFSLVAALVMLTPTLPTSPESSSVQVGAPAQAHVVGCGTHAAYSVKWIGSKTIRGQARILCPSDPVFWDADHVQKHKVDVYIQYRKPGTSNWHTRNKNPGSYNRDIYLSRYATAQCVPGVYEYSTLSRHVVNYRWHIGPIRGGTISKAFYKRSIISTMVC